MTDGAGVRTVTFDDKDNPLTQTTTYTGVPAQTITRTYYPDGSLQLLSTPAGNFSYSFDGGGRVTGMTNPFSESFSWTYLDNDWIWTQRSANAVVATYTYNALGQLTDLTNRTPGGTLLSEFSGMTYDGAGNRLTQTNTLNGAPSNYSGTTSY